jgi:hypothetical protein
MSGPSSIFTYVEISKQLESLLEEWEIVPPETTQADCEACACLHGKRLNCPGIQFLGSDFCIIDSVRKKIKPKETV